MRYPQKVGRQGDAEKLRDSKSLILLIEHIVQNHRQMTKRSKIPLGLPERDHNREFHREVAMWK